MKLPTILSESEYNLVNMGNSHFKPYLDYLKERVYQEYSRGYSVAVLSEFVVPKSKSTLYKYIQEIRDKIMYPILKNELKEVLLSGNLKVFLEGLSYQDLCLLGRKFRTYGWNKKDHVSRLMVYFENYSILGLFPENLDRDSIKRAFKRKAKQTHPDLNKNFGKNGLEFQRVHNAYEQLMRVW